ncbi:MAG: HEAT repeat domain-containing protein [Planctomycetota bacterium]
MRKNLINYLRIVFVTSWFALLLLTMGLCLMPAGYLSVYSSEEEIPNPLPEELPLLPDEKDLESQIKNLDEQIDFMNRFINRALQESPQEAIEAQSSLEELVAQRKLLEDELNNILSDQGSAAVPGERLVKTAEFSQIKRIYDSAQDLFSLSDRAKFEARTKELSASLESSLNGLENKAVIGRWVRQFFISEFQYFFRQAASGKGFEPDQTAADEEIIKGFYQEVDFLNEGLVTLQRNQEHHSWLQGLLKNRTVRNFKNVKKIPFKKRLEVLKIPREQYLDKLDQLMENYYDYGQPIKPDRINDFGDIKQVHPHRMIRESVGQTSAPVLIGLLKESADTVLVRRDPIVSGRAGTDWLPLAQRETRELYEDDLFDVQSVADVNLVLTDRRSIKIAGGAIVTGWELEPVVSETLGREIADLIQKLGDNDWQTRETATQSLIEIGIPARSALEEALNSSDPEVQMRAKMILKIGRIDSRRIVDKKLGYEFIVADSPPDLTVICQLLGSGKQVWSFQMSGLNQPDGPVQIEDKGDTLIVRCKTLSMTQVVELNKRTGQANLSSEIFK